MENRCFLLLDVGGTFVKSVVATYNGTILSDSESSEPIDSDGARADIEQAFAAIVSKGFAISTSHGYHIAGVGIAFPGPFDYNAGVSYMTHKFAALENVSVKEFFHSLPEIGADMPVVFMHDVTAALLGELCFGAAKEFKNVALITLGTGLGFAHAVDGEIQYNEQHAPAISLYNRPYKGEELEDFISKRGFLRAYAEVRGVENPDDLTVAAIGKAASEGEALALKSFHHVGTIIASEIEAVLNEYKIEALLFGGQISRSFIHFESALQPLFDKVATLKHISPMQNLSTAAPLGILSKLLKEFND